MDGLTEILSALLRVETKGESTLIMADCLRAIHALIDEEKEEEDA